MRRYLGESRPETVERASPFSRVRIRGNTKVRDYARRGGSTLVPKGSKDSARGFNPGWRLKRRPALKGRKIWCQRFI